MEKEDTIILIIIGVILIALIGKPLGLSASLPNDLQLFPTRFPLTYDYNLREGTNIINLNEGISLDNVNGLYYIGKGCSQKEIPKGSHGQTEQVSSSETITFNGKIYEISYSSCEVLFYGDVSFEENRYQHYEEKTVKLADTINSRNLNIIIDERDINSIDRKLKLFETVSCTRNSHCSPIIVNGKETPTKCDLNYHLCSLSSTPVPSYTQPVQTIELQKTSNADINPLLIIGGILLGFFLLYQLFRR